MNKDDILDTLHNMKVEALNNDNNPNDLRWILGDDIIKVLPNEFLSLHLSDNPMVMGLSFVIVPGDTIKLASISGKEMRDKETYTPLDDES